MDVRWELFEREAVEPRVLAFNEMTARALREQPSITALAPAQARADREQWAKSALDPSARWVDVPARHGPLSIRLFEHANPCGIYFHLHGGGWVLGGADHQDRLLATVRDLAHVTVVSVEYRLAPEHPFPVAVDDAEDALRHVIARASPELGAGRIVVGGESAGANLAVVALNRLRDKTFSNLAGACLQYGTYDLAGTPSLERADPSTPFLNRELSRWFRGHYTSEARFRHPEVSPLYADLAGLVPALFSVGTADPVIDDTLFMYARWRAAGNAAELAVYPGGLHGLAERQTPFTKASRERIAEFITRCLR